MAADTARARAANATRERILDVALEVLGRDPNASMSDIAAAARVVRRTVYGHFPDRADLVRRLTHRAVDEIAAVLTQVDSPEAEPDAVWVDFVAHLWPLAHRYRVLLALRRGQHGEEIHALLGPVDQSLSDLVRRGQADRTFSDHLPAELLSQIALSTVFAVADDALAHGSSDADSAAITSLLLLGVPGPRATTVVAARRQR